jgi:drug/metabolite transporter (DMT)-like permease
MPLAACPDCAREVSTQAPACIHCGRPMATSSSPANLGERPTAGIAAALVLGVLTIVWVVQRDPASSPEMRDANALINAIHVLGNAALLVFALLSLWGHRGANARIRGLCGVMITALCGAMLLLWRTSADLADPERTPDWLLAAVALFSTAVQIAPWLLYLRLFRASRHP